MIRSIDTLQHSFNVLQQKQITNSMNIANLSTSGYKAQQVYQSTTAAEDVVNYLDGADRDQQQELGSVVFGNQIDEIVRDMSQGAVAQTDSATDLALVGEGFFTVQGPDGTLFYTRNGNFKVNEEGLLVMQESTASQPYYVLGTDNQGQTGTIPVTADDFTVGADGTISGTGMSLLLTQVDPQTAAAAGDTLFTASGQLQPVGDVQVYQQYLEQSNADAADEMVQLMQLSREYEANQKVLQTTNETLQKATNELGKI